MSKTKGPEISSNHFDLMSASDPKRTFEIGTGKMHLRNEKWALPLCLGLMLALATGEAAACEASTASGGECFALRGRVYLANGTPSMRIAPIGSHRVLGVLPAENEDAPHSIRTGVTFDQDAIADLEICPLSLAKKGEMQMVCVRSASNVIFRNH